MKANLPLLALALLLPATAARAEEVVSNLANTSTAQIVLPTVGSSAAQAFTTGPTAASLVSIRFRARSPFNTNSTARVKLWSGDGNVPETLVEDLGTVSGIFSAADDLYTKTSTAGPVLAANTRYWVSVTVSVGDFDWRNTSDPASAGAGTFVQARATSPSGNAGTWTVPGFGSSANFQIMRVFTRDPIVVTTTADSGFGSLREAVADANGNPGPDTIVFDPAALDGETITLTSGQLLLDGDVTIDGTGLPAGITISGNSNGDNTLDAGESRIFDITAGKIVLLRRLNLINGIADPSLGTNDSFGGAIRSSGQLTIEQCTLSGSRAQFGGGLVQIGGSATLTQTTFSGNVATGSGGGIDLRNVANHTLAHCTLSGNAAAGDGGGINHVGGTVTLTNSIVAGNTAGGQGADIVNRATVIRTGANIVQSLFNDGGTDSGPPAIAGDPLLAPLGDYGGPTPTMPPLLGSPAIDTALGFPGATDQRGLPIGDYVYENDFSTGDLGGATVFTSIADLASPPVQPETGTVADGSFLFTGEVSNQVAALVLPAPPEAFTTFAASFDLSYSDPSGGTGSGGPADGISFSFGAPAEVGTFGGASGANAENGVPGAHRITLNTASFGGSPTFLNYRGPDGTTIDSAPIDRFGDAGMPLPITVTLDAAGTLTVTYKGEVAFTVPNVTYTHADGDTFTFAARTGGDRSEQRVDNIRIATGIPGGAPDIGAVESGLAIPGFAPTVVTSAADVVDGLDNGVSLREAVAFSPAGSTITFDPALDGGTITLGGSQILLDKDVTIDASALTGGIAISGNGDLVDNGTLDPGESRLFEVASGKVVVLRALRLIKGQASTTAGNISAIGGAILTDGSLNLDRCFVSECRAQFGGGIGCVGGSLTITQSTLSGNSASDSGGGIVVFGGSVEITQSTLSGNSAFRFTGGGIHLNTGSVEITRSIVAGNLTGGDIDGSFTDNGSNLLSGDPLLAPLGDYGGPTPTLPPLPGSPAIDAGGSTAETSDQRGFARVAGAAVDIGAVEAQAIPGFDPAVVTSLTDTFDGLPNGVSLREAVAFSPAGSTITFDPALDGGTITLGGSQILLDKSVTIDASALPGGIAISGNGDLVDNGTLDPGESRLFEVASGKTVVLRALRLIKGQASTTALNNSSQGGAIFTLGNITLDHCLVADCRARLGGGIAISSNGSLTITQSTLSGNSASFDGGGIFASEGDSVEITQSTLSGNSAVIGGGISSYDISTTITQSTLSGNSASQGGGINTFSGTLTLTRSIVAGNLTGGDITGSFSDNGNNLLSGDPLLAPLGDYGGPTPTLPPLPGSPAIDAGGSTTETTDQRGFARVVGAAVDIGAVEAQATLATSTAASGPGSVRETLLAAAPGSTVTFSPALSGATVVFASELLLDKDLVVDASSLPGGLVFSGDGATRLFRIAAGRSVEMRAMTFTGGMADLGGAFHNSGSLTLRRCTLAGNAATTSGGGIHNLSQLLLEHCTLSGNEAPNGGGLLNAAAGTAELVHSTLAANTAATDGGGVHNSGTLTLRQSLLSGNAAAGAGPDLREAAGTITLEGMNFVGELGGTTLAAGPALLAGDPLLGPLAANGGPTLTHAPIRGSVAIDPPGGATASPFATDQRGFLRVARGIVDIGAVEAQILRPALFAPSLVKASRNGRATIRGSSRLAISVRFSVAGQRGIKRTAGPPSRWIARVSKLKRPLSRVSVTALSVDGIRAIKMVKVRKAKPKR